MKVTIRHKVIEEFEVDVEDGLEGDELQEAVDEAQKQYVNETRFVEVESWSWEPAE